MSWITVIWSMVASVCLTLAAMHLLIWCKKRMAWTSLLFALTAAATAAVAGCELLLMRAETTREFSMIVRWGHVPYWVVILSLVGFVRLCFRAGRPWIAWTVCGMRTLSLLLNFLVGQNLNYREITGLRHIPFFWESVSVAEGVSNPWMIVGQLSLLLLVIFVADATVAVWRRGDRLSLVLLGGTIVFFVMGGLGQFVLAFWGFIHIPVTPSLFFLGIVTVMAYEMSDETLRASQLADDLHKNEEWLNLATDSAGVGLWLWDFRTNLIWITERTGMLYDFSSAGQIPFEQFLSRLHPDDHNWVVQASRKCLEEGADFRNDYRIVLLDGSIRWFQVLAKALITPSGKPNGMTGLSLDITDRKQAAQEIMQQRVELAHVARVSAMGELAVSLAHEFITLVRPEANSRNVRLATEPDSSLPPVSGDRVQLQQVLLNLLLNAMDAMNDSTSDGRQITVHVQSAGTQVEVAVSDTGHGIPADELAHIFEPFFSTKPNGLGMGLAISRSIIKAMGGNIRAKNNEAGGAKFTLTLPAVEGDDAR